MQTQKEEVQYIIQGTLLVIVWLYPARARRLLAADVPFVKVIPVPDEGILVEKETPIENSRISLFFKLINELYPQSPFDFLIFFHTGQVFYAVRVVSQVVHFVGGPFPEIHSPVFVFPVSALIEYKGFV